MGFTPISFVVSDSLEKKGIELDRQPDEIAKSSKKNFVWTLDSIKKVSIKKSLTNHFLSRKRGCVIKFSIEGKVLKRMLCCKTEAIQPARDVFRSLELY